MASAAKTVVDSARVRVQPKPPSAASSAPPAADPRVARDGEAGFGCDSLLMQNYANFKRSASPARLLYFSGDGSWLDLPLANGAFESLKLAFAAGRPMTDVSVDGARYLFDFLRMLQVRLESGDERLIAWIDENGKCFFPQTFLPDDEEPKNDHKIKIKAAVGENSINRKKEVLGKEAEMNSLKQPEQDNDALKLSLLARAEPSRWPCTRQLREGEMVFSLFKDFFMSGMKNVDPGAVVTAIYQFNRTGHSEKARYDIFEKQMEITRSLRSASNVVYAWHGASAKEVERILAHGFRFLSRIPVRESYGAGVYLSPLGLPHMGAMLAEVDDNGEKHVILCKVVLGNVETLQAGSQQYYPSSMDFDNAANDFVNPYWYIVWPSNMNTHIIPECVLSFKPSNIMRGQLRRLTYRPNAFEQLLTKIRVRLPPAKFRKLVTLYNAYKGGKVAKYTFFMLVRKVAGDDVLASAMQEIPGQG